ncbi:ABC transporter substrate-binding protein [Cellulosimicrobium sp. CUA-896]|uniref:ABC transporter substrate-binding protein n=1 Tax=Cellulosimicrobium sp. CUA-896 TaxID=1517881 RepID=UPI00210154F3|nr:ABC transporter substrate-binding protein [Cellulosimicrobium sp. CUA-896]
MVRAVDVRPVGGHELARPHGGPPRLRHAAAQGRRRRVPRGLATDWEATSASSYVFTVRDDATCSDGTPITAQVVADSLEHLAASDGTNTRSLAFGEGDPTFTVDEESGTLTIDLSAPYSQLLGGVTIEGTGIICPAGLADLDGLATGDVEGAFSGPYTLTDQVAGVSATYTLRDDYDAWPDWERVEGTPATTINITVESDSNTSANLLETGGLDVARFYDANATRFTDSDEFTYVTDNSTANTLLFNEDPSSVFADSQELRAAAAQAVSATAFNDAALDGLGNLMTSVTDSGFACVATDESLLQPYDPEAASEVLSGTTVRLLTMTNWEPAVDYVTEALSAAGADVEVTSLDAADWAQQLRTEPTTWDLTVRGETNSSGLVHQALLTKIGPSFGEGGTNYTSSDNAEGEAFLEAALSTADPEEQCADLVAAQETVLERVDVAPLATSTHYIIAREGINTYEFSGYWDVSALRIAS